MLRESLKRLWARSSPAPYGSRPRVLVNGYPKGGTHLLVPCVRLMGVYPHGRFFLSRGGVDKLALGRVVEGDDAVLVGVNHPCWVAASEVERLLGKVWAGEFIGGHLAYSDGMLRLLERYGFRMVLIVRDPRDVAVSEIHYLTSTPWHPWHLYYAQTLRTFEERLLATIRGVDGARAPTGEVLPNIGERVASVQPWLDVSSCYTTRFELLVGSQGGGEAEAQCMEITNIAQHLGLSLSSAQIQSIASRLFGRGGTFRRGRIGGWREVFKEEHKAAFKRVAGQQLIQLGYERNLDW